MEGASKVALTGDRFLTGFPNHLLWVKARRQSRMWSRVKRGVRLDQMVRAAGNRGNEILMCNSEKIFICLTGLSVFNCCGVMGVGTQGKREACSQPIKSQDTWSIFDFTTDRQDKCIVI